MKLWKRKWKWVTCKMCGRPVRKDLLRFHRESWCSRG